MADNFQPPDPNKLDDKGRPLRPWRKGGDGCPTCGSTNTVHDILHESQSEPIPDALNAPGHRTVFVQRLARLTCNACKNTEDVQATFRLVPSAAGGPLLELWDD